MRIEPIEGTGTLYGRVMARLGEAKSLWDQLDEELRFRGSLPPTLKEEVRRTLANGGACTYCASLNKARPDDVDERTSLAIGLAELAAAGAGHIDDSAWRVAASVFSERELVELCAWISFMYASQMFGAMVDLRPATDDEVAVYTSWRTNAA